MSIEILLFGFWFFVLFNSPIVKVLNRLLFQGSLTS